MTEHVTDGKLRLPGLDGSNPLGFLAALGVLRVLNYHARGSNRPLPRMGWTEAGYWQPEILGCSDVDTLVSVIMEDKATWAGDPALALAYDTSGGELIDPTGEGSQVVRDLKPLPGTMRLFLDTVARVAEAGALDNAQWLVTHRALETVGFYGSEVIQDNKGNTKPFALHFTAGQQAFLRAIAELQAGVDEGDVTNALVGPWAGVSKLPSMSWDATVARIYALRASDPSAERRGSNPGADWLAFLGLGLFCAAPQHRTLVTTAVRGGWKDAVFTWPLWTPPLTSRVVRSVLAMEELPTMARDARVRRGIAVLFSSCITRSDQGGYGGFSPSWVV